MRQITVRFGGQCRKCGADIPIGAEAIHEKHVGLFCLTCAPTDTEAIREYRQEAADRRADKYEDWAAKRRERAGATLNYNREHFTSDIAFNTQPGHFPLRARVIAQNDKAYESLNIAQGFERKAESLRHVRVAGDAERDRQAKRDAIRARISKGTFVDTVIYGRGTVEKINKKTATVNITDRGFKVNVDLSWLIPIVVTKQEMQS